jgi:polysaccharide export outer membrane protein
MLYLGIFTAFIISWGIVVYLTPKLLLLSLKKKMIDYIDGRKIHTSVASRFGGFSFFPAIVISVCLGLFFICLNDKQIGTHTMMLKLALGFGSLLIIFLLGVGDDIIGVRYRKKFFFQMMAAILIVLSGTWIKSLHGFCGIEELPDYIGMALTVFLLVFITNSINLIDGIDGLASLLSIITLLVYGILFVSLSSVFYSVLAFATLGALIPFFYFNVFGIKPKYSSKIFMGDAGSLLIGFILGCMAVELWNTGINGEYGAYPYVLSYTMLIIPCIDAVRVICSRIKEHRAPFLPDNNHIHHRLMRRGLSQHQVLLTIVLAQIFFLILNIFLVGISNIHIIIIADFIYMIMFMMVIKKTLVKKIIYFLFFIMLLTSCGSTRNISYLQDVPVHAVTTKVEGDNITIHPRDMLYIMVSSKNPQLAMLFNLPRVQLGINNTEMTNTQRGDVLGYTVDSNGYIDFPVLGKIKIAGLNREEVESLIKETLIARDLIKDPVVTVIFSNLTFSVLGEVANPGQYNINKDQITILEALSKAGDLTIHGKRDKVFVIRENETDRITYQLDLRSSMIYNSPAFYIRQNDVIYIEPNKVRASQSTVNGNNVRSVSLWLSIASFFTTIGVLIFK